MRKRMYAILLAAVLTGSLASGCVSAFAAETEASAGTVQTEVDAAQAAAAGAETEAEASTEKPLLQPESVTGDSGFEAQYPSIEAQVEQQLTMLSNLSETELESMIKTYNKQINLSVRDIANSMKDASVLTSEDDATMATVKMLRNWYANRESCGQFVGVRSYTADMTNNVLTMDIDAEYSEADKNDAKIDVKFTYDLGANVSLLTWEVKDSFAASIGKAGMNTLIGLGTVFVVLLFLTFIISQIHWIPDILNGKQKKQQPAAAAAPAPAPVIESAPVEAEDETDDLELVAVISAAIAASEQAPVDGFVVRSIRRRDRKSNWRA